MRHSRSFQRTRSYAVEVTLSRIEARVSFTVAEWKAGDDEVLARMASRLATGDKLMVRSTELSEDGFGVSNAGSTPGPGVRQQKFSRVFSQGPSSNLFQGVFIVWAF